MQSNKSVKNNNNSDVPDTPIAKAKAKAQEFFKNNLTPKPKKNYATLNDDDDNLSNSSNDKKPNQDDHCQTDPRKNTKFSNRPI